MPDQDVCVPGLSRRWQSPFRLTQGEHPIDFVADAILASLVGEIRNRGLSCLDELREIVGCVAVGELSASQGLYRLDSLTRIDSRDPNIRLGTDAAAKIIASISQGAANNIPDAEAVAKAFCIEVVEHRFIAPAIPALAERLNLSEEDAYAWGENVRVEIAEGITQVAQRLVRDPSGKSVRKPSVRGRERLSTEQILEISLV